MYLGRAERYISVFLYLVQSGYTIVLRMLAVDLCRNENDASILNHRNDYTETKQTTASSLHELRRYVKKMGHVARCTRNKDNNTARHAK